VRPSIEGANRVGETTPATIEGAHLGQRNDTDIDRGSGPGSTNRHPASIEGANLGRRNDTRYRSREPTWVDKPTPATIEGAHLGRRIDVLVVSGVNLGRRTDNPCRSREPTGWANRHRHRSREPTWVSEARPGIDRGSQPGSARRRRCRSRLGKGIYARFGQRKRAIFGHSPPLAVPARRARWLASLGAS
jgi:hypothetical protein